MDNRTDHRTEAAPRRRRRPTVVVRRSSTPWALIAVLGFPFAVAAAWLAYDYLRPRTLADVWAREAIRVQEQQRRR